jgi:tetratricopeptide (TPR) repeat protein
VGVACGLSLSIAAQEAVPWDIFVVKLGSSTGQENRVPPAQARFAAGVALVEKADFDGAIQQFREALRLNPYVAKWHVALGKALSEKGELRAAIAEYREAVRLQPFFWYAHHQLMKVLCVMGEFEAAEAAYDDQRRLRSDVSFYDCPGYEARIEQYRARVTSNPDDAEARNNLGWAFGNTAIAVEYMEGPAAAIREFREAIRLKPDFTEAHYNLGLALLGKGDLDEATAEFREAIRLKPDFVGAHLQLGETLLDYKEDAGGAFEAYQEALRINPNDAMVQYRLVQVVKSKAAKVEGALRELLMLHADLAEAHEALGEALVSRCELDTAITEFRHALRLKPQLTEARYGLADALDRKGDIDGAVGEWLEAELLDTFQSHMGGIPLSSFPDPKQAWVKMRQSRAELGGRSCKPTKQ